MTDISRTDVEAQFPLPRPVVTDSRSPNLWLACLVALATLLALANFAIDSTSGAKFGWDARVNCAAVDAHVAGRDPYFVRNLTGESLSYPYLPITLDVFRPLCDGGFVVHHHMGLYLAFAALCCLLLVRIDSDQRSLRESLLRILFAFGGFLGFEWTFLSGNFTILTGLLTSVALLLLMQRPSDGQDEGEESFVPRLAGAAVLGLLTSFKLVFCPVLAALYFLPLPRNRKLMLIATGAGMFALPILMSMVFYADLFPSWFKLVSGQMPEQHSPVLEGMNPSLFFLARAFVAALGLGGVKPIVFGAYVLTALALVVTPFTLTVLQAISGSGSSERKSPLKMLDQWLLDHPREATRLALLAMYALYLCSPRLKEYSFFELAIYGAVLVAELPSVALAAVLVVGVAIPSVSSLLGNALEGTFGQLGAALFCFWIMLSEFRKRLGAADVAPQTAAR